MTEERERDVQVVAAHDADAGKLLALPALDGVEDLVGQPQCEEEPEPFIIAHASGRNHADSS